MKAAKIVGMTTFNDILVPIDYEASADAALRVAGELARGAKGRLLVVHVLPLPIYTLTEYPIAPIDVQWIREETERLHSHVRTLLGGDDAPPFEVDVRVDTPVLRIIELAAERRVELIVMGTHGRKGIRHLLLGSIAANIARLAPCPVLIVPATRDTNLGALLANGHASGHTALVGGAREVGTLMHRSPVTITSEAMLAAAASLMAEHGIRHLPVVDDGRLVGMLGSADLGPHAGQLARTKVNAAMTPDPTTVRADDEAATGAGLMIEKHVRALPVVEGERVVGVLSAVDVLEDYALAARR